MSNLMGFLKLIPLTRPMELPVQKNQWFQRLLRIAVSLMTKYNEEKERNEKKKALNDGQSEDFHTDYMKSVQLSKRKSSKMVMFRDIYMYVHTDSHFNKYKW